MSAMNDKDYYAVLGVDKSASTDEIRRAFQKKAVKLHPDVNKEPGAEEKFKEISEAYAVLSDPEKRRHYDQMRANPFASGGMPTQPQGGSYGYGGSGDPFGWGGFPFGGAGAPFGGSYSRGSSSRRSRAYNPKVGADIVYELNLTAKEAKEGVTKGVTYQRYDTCAVCHGSGSGSSGGSATCPTCGGTGHVAVDLSWIFGAGAMEMECPECEGTGRVVAEPCEHCGGSGREISASEVVVEVPGGSHDGYEVRVRGKGNVGTNGREAGDFVCRVCVAEERLDAKSSGGFQLLGFIAPFYVFGLIARVLPSVAFVCTIPLVIALFLIISGGLAYRGATWWGSAGRAFANGAASGVVIALFTTAFMSCSSSLGTAGTAGASQGVWA